MNFVYLYVANVLLICFASREFNIYCMSQKSWKEKVKDIIHVMTKQTVMLWYSTSFFVPSGLPSI